MKTQKGRLYMKSIYLRSYLHIFCSFNIACLYLHFIFRSTHSFHFILLFFLQFFFSSHITFLYSFSELLYKFIADFALFKTVLEGMYLWAGPEWLILHESRAQTVLLSNVILFSVTIFRTMLNTLSDVFVPLARACGWGISRADIHHSFPRVSEMLKSQLQNLKNA